MAQAHGVHADLARLRDPSRIAPRPHRHRGRLQRRAARYRGLLPRASPHPVVGGLPVLSRHGDQRRHHHRGPRHRLQRELGIRAVLRGLEPGQARRRLSLHPRLLPLRLHHHLRVPAPPLRSREPGDGLDLLLHHAAPGLGGATHGRRAGRGRARRLAALGDHRPLHGRLHCVHRPGRGPGRGVDQRLSGEHLSHRRRAHRRFSRLQHRRRTGGHARHRRRGRTARRHQLGTRAGRARFLAARAHRPQHLLARRAQRLRRLHGRLRDRPRLDAASPHRGDARGEPAHPRPHAHRDVGDAAPLSRHRGRALHVLRPASRRGAAASG